MAKKLFTKTLQNALRDSEVSRYRISKLTGISEGNLSRVAHGKAGLSIENLDILIEFLGLELRPKQSKVKKNG